MKNLFVTLALVLASLGALSVSADAEAKRLGGGRPAGMQRQAPAKAPDATPAKPAQPANAAAPAPAAAPAAAPGKRSWMGPLAGLAAGLGIAALMSHLGMGEQFGNFLMMALLAMVAIVAIRWVMGRLAQSQNGAARAGEPQLAGVPSGGSLGSAPFGQASADRVPAADNLSPLQREAAGVFGGGVNASAGAAQPRVDAPAAALPEGFDAEGFARLAKLIFIRLQAANDAGNVDDLRKFTTPELFASLRLDLQERGAAGQQTDVVKLEAEMADSVREADQWVVSVRFHGLIREEASAPAGPFNELWHLVKPLQGEHDWAIAGITPLDA